MRCLETHDPGLVQVTLWDLSLERDEEAEAELLAQGMPVPDIPPQLIFIHRELSSVPDIPPQLIIVPHELAHLADRKEAVHAAPCAELFLGSP